MDQDSLWGPVVDGLRADGFDVLTSLEASNQRASDFRQLEFATQEGRVIYTANRADFARLHAQWMRQGKHHAGIIIRVRQDESIAEQLRDLQGASPGVPGRRLG